MAKVSILVLMSVHIACGMSTVDRHFTERVDLYDVLSFAVDYKMTHGLHKVMSIANKKKLMFTCQVRADGFKIVALNGTHTVGSVVVGGSCIASIQVSPQFLNQGIGRALMLSAFYKICERAHNDCVGVYWLAASSDPKGLPQEELVQFYETFGAIRKYPTIPSHLSCSMIRSFDNVQRMISSSRELKKA
jgi:GNAT superfamily N-acetyltransferase